MRVRASHLPPRLAPHKTHKTKLIASRSHLDVSAAAAVRYFYRISSRTLSSPGPLASLSSLWSRSSPDPVFPRCVGHVLLELLCPASMQSLIFLYFNRFFFERAANHLSAFLLFSLLILDARGRGFCSTNRGLSSVSLLVRPPTWQSLDHPSLMWRQHMVESASEFTYSNALVFLFKLPLLLLLFSKRRHLTCDSQTSRLASLYFSGS